MKPTSLLVTKQINTVDDVATGNRVRLEREKLNITQAELAKRLGLSPSHMNNLESGKRGFSKELVANIVSALKRKP